MSINAEVQKSGAESALSVIRKFSRKVQGTGLIQTVRKGRYYSRAVSKTVSKKKALKRIARYEHRQELIKEGKLAEQVPRRGHHHRPQQNTGSQTAAQAAAPASTVPARSSGLGESTPIAR